MNQRIDYIIKHERFPFSVMEYIVMGIIALSVLAICTVAILHYKTITAGVIILVVAAILLGVAYAGIGSTMKFNQIQTQYNQLENEKIIQLCLAHLNIKAYRDNEYSNVFVCFIHNSRSDNRQEIYLIAKDDKVLINSNNNKGTDEGEGQIDFVEKIGLSIYITARDLKKRQWQA